ncbi:MAG: hypothetical protein E4H23_05100 [Chrysiogenales bacterium]|jgi:hypothetical protein|nr:MAG: hypothetical protein E4H23_05100 [Chrysiogenales bacterium]
MKKILALTLIAASALALPAMDESFAKGQLFISAYAGFVPAAANNWDVMYNLCFESAISRDVSLGFAYSQKQSHAGENQDRLAIPFPARTTETDELTYANITTRLFCLEGKYHFAFTRLRRLDLFCGAGLGLELNKDNSLHFIYANQELVITYTDKNHYYLVANFFGGGQYYFAENLALAAKAGYQYSGISGYDAVLSLGITFRIK